MSEGNIAIIPARGGSKRIPKKNVRLFLGKPIIAYSIKAAFDSKLFDEVMVSTDDDEIASIAQAHGAHVPVRRSRENSSDYATTFDVIKEVLEFYVEGGRVFSYGCCIYPTAPFIRARHLQEGFQELSRNGYDSVCPVVPFSYPIWRGFERSHTGKVSMVWPEYKKSRSQDLKPIFHDAGQWYWFNCDTIQYSLFTDNTGSIILPEEEVQDIDNESDWLIAEMKYRRLYDN